MFNQMNLYAFLKKRCLFFSHNICNDFKNTYQLFTDQQGILKKSLKNLKKKKLTNPPGRATLNPRRVMADGVRWTRFNQGTILTGLDGLGVLGHLRQGQIGPTRETTTSS